MGWTVVEPLSPGVFQIDPSVYGAEPNRVFNVTGGTQTSRQTAKRIALAMFKKIKAGLTASMEAIIKSKVGDDIGVKISDELGTTITDRAAKNVDAKFPDLADEAAGKLGPKGTAPARRQRLINTEAGKLADGYADDLAKGLDADDIGKTLDLDDVAGFNKYADDVAQKGGKGIVDDVVQEGGEKTTKELTQEASEKTKTTLDDAGTGNNKGLSETQKGIYRMANRTGLSVIALWGAYSLLLPIAEATGGAVGDAGEGVLTIFTGENCRGKVESNYPSNPEVWAEKTEECESQAAFRTMLMGGAAVSLLGVLGIVLITRLLPSKPAEEEDEEEPEE